MELVNTSDGMVLVAQNKEERTDLMGLLKAADENTPEDERIRFHVDEAIRGLFDGQEPWGDEE